MTRRSNFSSILARGLWLAFGVTAVTAVTAAIAAEPAPVHVRGTIVAATADNLTVQTTQGKVSLALDPTTKIAGVVPSSPDQIKEGTFVGIANVPGSGSSRALEVVVFPESMKGSGLGDYPWDLSAAGEGGAKTSAMTNGTVKKAASANGLSLTVDHGKGEKTIQVPAGVPMVGLVPADSSKLLPGAHVFVAVGIDGTVPPM